MAMFATQEMKTYDTKSPEQIKAQLKSLGYSDAAIDEFFKIATSDVNEQFQQSIIDPAMRAYQQDIIPGIQERFGGDTAASSALNQTLAQSAENLGSMLGAQFGDFYTKQQGQKMDALQYLLNFGQQPYQNQYLENKPGWFDQVLDSVEKGVDIYKKYTTL